MKVIKHSTSRSQQHGAALVVSLMMLLVMTLIGITAMNTTVLEEKMAGNSRQRQLAFQSAEAALRSAEDWLFTNVTNVAAFETTFNGTPAELYWERKPRPGSTLRPITIDVYDHSAWAVGNSQEPATSVTSATDQQDPRYVIEYLGRSGEPPLDVNDPDPRPYAFRITSIGWGTDNTTTYVAQSTYRIAL
ncbi:MAG: hypothetical protein J5I92_14390 [Thiogranum sp.]|nr:hypothetical protein [Thiogranum sp.]